MPAVGVALTSAFFRGGSVPICRFAGRLAPLPSPRSASVDALDPNADAVAEGLGLGLGLGPEAAAG